MLRSSSRSPVITIKTASEITSASLRVNKELPLVSFLMRWVEGYISHSRRVLRRCRPKEPSCSRQFGCRLFIKHTPWAVYFRHMKKLACFMRHNSAGLHRTFHFQILYERLKKLQANGLNLTCRTISVCKLLQIVWFDGMTFLTALILGPFRTSG